MRRKGNLMQCLWECRLVQPLWKTVWCFLKKLKMELPYDQMNPLLVIYLKKPEILIQRNICTPMFIAVLFMIAKIWKQPKGPSVDEWIKKLWYIYTMEYYLDVKRRKSYLLWEQGWTWRYYAKWNKPVREKQIPHDFTCMWNLMNKIEINS